jgi:hypothetical protein
VLAIAAAALTAWAVWFAAKLPIDAENARLKELRGRQLAFTRASLSAELQTLLTRALMADATITNVVAANAHVTDDTRAKCYLHRPTIVDEWEFMSLLAPGLFDRVVALYALVEAHNFDMDRAGGAFGTNAFQQLLHARIGQIRGLAQGLRGSLSTTAQPAPPAAATGA